MATIRQRINFALLPKDEKLFRTHGITENGVLTDVGRRIVLDIMFEDKELRKTVAARVQTAVDDEKDEK